MSPTVASLGDESGDCKG